MGGVRQGLVAVVALVAACGGVTVSPVSARSHAASTPSAAGQAARTLSFTLTGIGPNAAIHGTAVVDISAGSGYTITTTAFGLKPGSGHGIHIHNGTCDHIDLAGVDVRVGHEVADGSGRIVDVSSFPGLWRVNAGGQVLTVHGNDPPVGIFEDQYTAIACAQLTAS